MNSSVMGQGRPLFDVAHPAFPLPTTASPTLQGARNDGSGGAVVACDMPEPYKFPSLPFYLIIHDLVLEESENTVCRPKQVRSLEPVSYTHLTLPTTAEV